MKRPVFLIGVVLGVVWFFSAVAGGGGNHDVCERKPWKPECQTTTTLPPTTTTTEQTTTTTEPPTTTTTEPPTTTTTEPPTTTTVPETTTTTLRPPLECVDTDGYQFLVDPYSYDECPEVIQPTTDPPPLAERPMLPNTGGRDWMIWLGVGLLAAGMPLYVLWRVSRERA
jgi:hypothetical protein